MCTIIRATVSPHLVFSRLSVCATQADNPSASFARVSLDHFHVHITHITSQVAGSAVGQSHLLDTSIDNIENITPDYYSRASLRFALGVNHPVFELITNGAQQHW